MFKPIVALALMSFLSSSQSLALSLSQALLGEGSLQIKRDLKISGADRSGGAAYLQEVVYQDEYSSILPRAPSDESQLDLSKLSCMAMISTRGEDVTLSAGTVLPWNTDSLTPARFETYTENGRTHEWVHLFFYGDHSRLTQIDCSLSVKSSQTLPLLSVEDFEIAMGGKMKIAPSVSP